LQVSQFCRCGDHPCPGRDTFGLIIERLALVLKRKLPPGAAGPFPVIATVGAVSIGLMYHFVLGVGLEQLTDFGRMFFVRILCTLSSMERLSCSPPLSVCRFLHLLRAG
jgi:hypothetical protein